MTSYTVIEEPPGVARGISLVDGRDAIYLYFGSRQDSISMIYHGIKNLKLSDFKNKIVKGIAVKRNNYWCTQGTVIYYFHINAKWPDQ